jgi:hypothetical protein
MGISEMHWTGHGKVQQDFYLFLFTRRWYPQSWGRYTYVQRSIWSPPRMDTNWREERPSQIPFKAHQIDDHTCVVNLSRGCECNPILAPPPAPWCKIKGPR